jgi:prevent-host-death family protein
MTRIISASAARAQFGWVLRRAASKQERFLVDRNGQPQVVILSVQDYLRNFIPEPEILRVIRENARRTGAARLTMRQINAEISACRRERRRKNGSAPGGA